jgi:hypothetical protein
MSEDETVSGYGELGRADGNGGGARWDEKLFLTYAYNSHFLNHKKLIANW